MRTMEVDEITNSYNEYWKEKKNQKLNWHFKTRQNIEVQSLDLGDSII